MADHVLIFGPKNQRVIFSPQSVHGSVHIGDSIPLNVRCTFLHMGISVGVYVHVLCMHVYVYPP